MERVQYIKSLYFEKLRNHEENVEFVVFSWWYPDWDELTLPSYQPCFRDDGGDAIKVKNYEIVKPTLDQINSNQILDKTV